MRRMSFAMTTDAVIERRKTVTRRLGWWFLKPGDRLLAVDKLRTKNARKLGVIEVVSARREKLFEMPESDVALEGFDFFERCDSLPDGPHHEFPSRDCVSCFVETFLDAMPRQERKGFETCGGYVVNRIEFRYVEGVEGRDQR